MLTGNLHKPGQGVEQIFSITEPDLLESRKTTLLKLLTKCLSKFNPRELYISAIKYEFLVVEWMVFESFDYIIINEAECLQQLYLSKTFQRNVFSSVICHKKIE